MWLSERKRGDDKVRGWGREESAVTERGREGNLAGLAGGVGCWGRRGKDLGLEDIAFLIIFARVKWKIRNR